jgi:hypothetical protein
MISLKAGKQEEKRGVKNLDELQLGYHFLWLIRIGFF